MLDFPDPGCIQTHFQTDFKNAVYSITLSQCLPTNNNVYIKVSVQVDESICGRQSILTIIIAGTSKATDETQKLKIFQFMYLPVIS